MNCSKSKNHLPLLLQARPNQKRWRKSQHRRRKRKRKREKKAPNKLLARSHFYLPQSSQPHLLQHRLIHPSLSQGLPLGGSLRNTPHRQTLTLANRYTHKPLQDKNQREGSYRHHHSRVRKVVKKGLMLRNMVVITC